MILLISASPVARIAGVSLWHPALWLLFKTGVYLHLPIYLFLVSPIFLLNLTPSLLPQVYIFKNFFWPKSAVDEL
jgi:hypothetical protein